MPLNSLQTTFKRPSNNLQTPFKYPSNRLQLTSLEAIVVKYPSNTAQSPTGKHLVIRYIVGRHRFCETPANSDQRSRLITKERFERIMNDRQDTGSIRLQQKVFSYPVKF